MAGPLCSTGIRTSRLAFAAYEPLTGKTQNKAMPVSERTAPSVTRAVSEAEDFLFINGIGLMAMGFRQFDVRIGTGLLVGPNPLLFFPLWKRRAGFALHKRGVHGINEPVPVDVLAEVRASYRVA
jgi:hypothetical protein